MDRVSSFTITNCVTLSCNLKNPIANIILFFPWRNLYWIFFYTDLEVDWFARISGKYKLHLLMRLIERVGYSLFCAISFLLLFFFLFLGPLFWKTSRCEVWWSVEKSLLPVYKTPIWKIGDFICCDNKMHSLRPDLDTKGIPFFIFTVLSSS